MTRRRLFLPLEAEPSQPVALDAQRRHYLVDVLRLGDGEALEVFDGRGHAWTARLALAAAGASLSLSEPRAAFTGRPVTLVQGLPKGEKLDWVLQKGTELGASAFVPASTARSVVKLSPERGSERLRRWRKIVEEAARQCGRSDVPSVEGPASLDAAISSLPPSTRVLVLDTAEAGTRLGRALDEAPLTEPLALVVGPEGGLAPEETRALVQRGARGVTLGRSILRTETAALAALAIIRHREGVLG